MGSRGERLGQSFRARKRRVRKLAGREVGTIRWSGEESGAGTVGVALAMLASGIVMVGMLQLFYTAWERMGVRNDADLAAVSAAIVLRDTGSVELACQRAEDIADPSAVSCFVDGEVVTIEASRSARFSWITHNHRAQAVAGPARREPG